MNALPMVNPYESPQLAADLPLNAPAEGTWLGFAGRIVAYAAAGAGIFAAFCTPLNLAQEMFWSSAQGPNPFSLGCVVASSVITGMVLDVLVRSEWHCVLVGLLWAMLNAVVFTFLFLLVAGELNPQAGLPQRAAGAALLAVIFGSLYGVLCMHLALPVSAVCVWLARLWSDRQRVGGDPSAALVAQ